MTLTILNQPVQKFISGPKDGPVTYNAGIFNADNEENSNDEKAAYHADLSQGYELEPSVDNNFGYIYTPFNAADERYD